MLKNHPENYVVPPNIHSNCKMKYIFIDSVTGYQCEMVRWDCGTYRAYLKISENHPYINHPNFDQCAKDTIIIHDGLDYGSKTRWGISFCVPGDYCPLNDELGLRHKKFLVSNS